MKRFALTSGSTVVEIATGELVLYADVDTLCALALRCVEYVPMTEKELREETIAAANKVRG